MQIRWLDTVPDGLLALRADALRAHLGGPTVIHLSGRRKRPLVLTVLQHGNEDTGWEALRTFLSEGDAHRPLPRDLIVFIANVAAAAQGVRSLPEQPDYNRCWPGHLDTCESDVHKAFADLTERIERLQPFAAIDIHNNSGRNPHYAAINRLLPQWQDLARRFDRLAVYYRHPKGVQSEAFSQFAPAITIECGMAGTATGIPHCQRYLSEILQLESLPQTPPTPCPLLLYHTVARVRISDDTDFSFDEESAPLRLLANLDDLNFEDLTVGTLLGRCRNKQIPLTASDANGGDVTNTFFTFDNGEIRLRRPSTPSMLSTNHSVVRQDCLCYLMERICAGAPIPETALTS